MTPSESRALMQRELDEQPMILEAAAGPLAQAAAQLRPDPARPVWIGGCGDSLFAAQALALFARRLGWDARPASAAEMLWDAPIARGDTVVGISISGSTRRTVEALAAASDRGARTLAVTLNKESALARVADNVLPLPFTPISRTIPHGLDYHVTMLALAALFGEVSGPEIGALFSTTTPGQLSSAREIAGKLKPGAGVFFLGGGAALGSANYGAAKLHEAGGLRAWSFEAENFAHGAVYLPRPGDHIVLCGAAAPADARTAALAADLPRLNVSISLAALEEGLTPLSAAFTAALAAQTLCLALGERYDLDVTDSGQGSDAAAVQRDLFAWSLP